MSSKTPIREKTGDFQTIHSDPRSAYIHVPFCAHRCGYCDFSIIAGRSELIPRYLRALEVELNQSEFRSDHPGKLDTLYLGGGTPTLLDAAQLRQLLQLLKKHLQLAVGAEFTIEANPDGLSLEKLQVLQEAGINRVSLGVQSFEAPRLIQLERTHSIDETFESIAMIEKMFGNYSIDLIFAIPGQTLSEWERMLDTAISLQPPHISTYALTFEKGTRFWADRYKGRLESAPEDLEVRMYQFALEKLQAAGYRHYEISNFARPGSESRHNSVYWSGLPFLAFGPGAASFLHGQRRTNHRSSFTWMHRLEQGQSPTDLIDDLSIEERARELLAIGLRQRDGIRFQQLQHRIGIDVHQLCKLEIDELVQKGWLEQNGDVLRMTDTGLFLADEIAAHLI